jgi:hypothetical protein
MVYAGQISPRAVARQRKSRDVRLGVKWSPAHLQLQPTMSVLGGRLPEQSAAGWRLLSARSLPSAATKADVSPRPTQKPSEICAVRTFFTGIKRSALINALDGRFHDHHGELARMLLDQIDTLTAQIATLTSRIERLLAAMPDKRSRGDPTTGGDRDTTARPTDAALLSRSSGSTRSPAPASRTRRPSWPRSDWTWPGSPPPRTWCRGRNCARAPFSPEW